MTHHSKPPATCSFLTSGQPPPTASSEAWHTTWWGWSMMRPRCELYIFFNCYFASNVSLVGMSSRSAVYDMVGLEHNEAQVRAV